MIASLARHERMAVSANKPEEVRWMTTPDGEVELEIDESPVYLWLQP